MALSFDLGEFCGAQVQHPSLLNRKPSAGIFACLFEEAYGLYEDEPDFGETCATENTEMGAQFDPWTVDPFSWSSSPSAEWNKQNKRAPNYEAISQVEGGKGLIPEDRVTEITKTVPLSDRLAAKGASISLSLSYPRLHFGLRNKQDEKNGGSISSNCPVRRSFLKSPGLKATHFFPVLPVHASSSYTEGMKNSQPQLPTPENLKFALLGVTLNLLGGVLKEHVPKLWSQWYKTIPSPVPNIDMLMQLVGLMPKICMASSLAAYLGWMIWTKLSDTRKANAVTDETKAAKYEGGSEFRIEGKGLKIETEGLKMEADKLKIEEKGFKMHESGNCGKVIPMNIEDSPGASITIFSIVNSFNGNCAIFLAIIVALVKFIFF